MGKLVLIDGNSILNRVFYGTMSSKLMMTEDGTYTNYTLAITRKKNDKAKFEVIVLITIAVTIDNNIIHNENDFE